ncbi:HAD hydrolase-like protein [Paenibacillus pasadenensis]|uniref:HAD hydrolase-like protein n=1 Tax=Paenibacillus pasadenensis TaxID=217090 RepID=UPI00203F211F|nr:HAD hydrolase-like protein [Paenibacillus pasadenensis]MCM3749250.1 HAD hydrolase-like protein [Paenibacillus pasadenensis]
MSFTVIFDMDGTLFQTNQILGLALEDTFAHFRNVQLWAGDAPLEKYQQIMGVPLPVVWETLMPDHSAGIREQANELFLERLIAHIQSGKGALYPDVEAVLQHLTDAGCTVYVASNGLAAYLKAINDYFRLDRWVTEIYSIEQISSQNKSDLVQLIKINGGITHGAVVGDRMSDIKAARDNGLISIGCRFDFAQEDELTHADIVIDRFIDLKSVLKEFIDN